MKRIEFIAPVDSMRGNLSGKQDLVYPTNDNKAYDSPEGSVNYARNYRPSFIGAKRSSDGLKYFAVKTKSAIHMTTKSKREMALMGGAGAIMAAILRYKDEDLYLKLQLALDYAQVNNLTKAKTLRAFLTPIIRKALARKYNYVLQLTYAVGQEVVVNNPWINSAGQTQGAVVDAPIIDKFMLELGPRNVFRQVITLADGTEYHFYAVSGKTCNEMYNGASTISIAYDDFGNGEAILGAPAEGQFKIITPDELNGKTVNTWDEEEQEATPVQSSDQIYASSVYVTVA